MFTLDGIVFDRLQIGIAEDMDGNLMYTLPQMSEATIEQTAESKDAKDKDGNLIKRSYRAKGVKLSVTNALIDYNIVSEQYGSKKQVASESAKIQLPKIMIVSPTTEPIDLGELVEGTAHVSAIAGNGTMGKSYASAAAASANEFSISESKLTLPTDSTATQYIVKYERMVTSGVLVENRADKFPKTFKFTIKALAYDPCEPDTLRAAYIVFPSFQVSPETSLPLSTDATFDFSGDAQVDYCSKDKKLVYVGMAEDDVEDEE